MKIKLLVSLAAAHGAFSAGDVVTWPDAKDAQRLIDAKYAEAVPEPKPAPKPIEKRSK